jgi:diaminopimelate decarboxylase
MPDAADILLSRFGARDGVLHVGGRSVRDIVREYGSPLYLYVREQLVRKREALRAALPPELLITYAVKANPNHDVLTVLAGLYDGADVASAGEMRAALAAGFPAAALSFAGPSKSREELQAAIAAGIGTLSAESPSEIGHIRDLATAAGRAQDVLIRVNPPFEFTGSGLKMGGGSKQFGIDSELVPGLVRELSAGGSARYRGIHVFAGTQNLDAQAIAGTFAQILAYVVELARETGIVPPIVNLGGGFGIPYFKGDRELDLDALGTAVRALLAEYAPRLPGARFKIELGRYLAGEAGLYLTSVRYRKVSRGKTFLALDGGMHQHLAASGNISLSPIKRQMQIAVATNLGGPGENVGVVGPLCTPLDNFGLNLELPHADEGDILAIPNAGAYGYTMSPLAFLSHPAPREVLV